MSRGRVDTFALVIDYLNDSWNPMHVTIGLFEVHETIGFCMASQLHILLEKFDLMHTVIAFERWRQQSNVYGDNITFESSMDLWRYMFCSHYV